MSNKVKELIIAAATNQDDHDALRLLCRELMRCGYGGAQTLEELGARSVAKLFFPKLKWEDWQWCTNPLMAVALSHMLPNRSALFTIEASVNECGRIILYKLHLMENVQHFFYVAQTPTCDLKMSRAFVLKIFRHRIAGWEQRIGGFSEYASKYLDECSALPNESYERIFSLS